MRVFKIIVLLYLILLCLVGCEAPPQDFGIKKQDWYRYSEQEQNKILDHYRVISANLQRSKQAACVNGSWLQVNIRDGQVMFPPFIKQYNYTPNTFRICQGTCKDVELYNEEGDNYIVLTACYKNDILFLDPSLYEINKQDGTVCFHASPLWREGFTYPNVNSHGYVRLQDATVTIKKLVSKL